MKYSLRNVAVVSITTVLLLSGCYFLIDPSRTVLARVGPVKITQGDLDDEISAIDDVALKATMAKRENRQMLLGEIVARRLLLLEAEAKGIYVTREEIDEARGKQPDINAVAKIMDMGNGQHIDLPGPTRAEIEKKLKIDKLVQNEVYAKVPPDEAQKFYEANKERLVSREYSYRYVASGDARTIYNIQRKILEGESFDNIVSHKEQYPELTTVIAEPRTEQDTQMDSSISGVLSGLKMGEVSELIPIGSEYGLFQKTGERVVRKLEFDEVRDLLWQQIYGNHMSEFFSDLKRKYPTKVYEERVSRDITDEM